MGWKSHDCERPLYVHTEVASPEVINTYRLCSAVNKPHLMLSLSRSGEEKTTSASPSLSHWNMGSHGHPAIHSGSGAGALTTELSLQPLILLGAQGVVQTNQEGARLKMDGIDRLHHPRQLLPYHFRLGRGLGDSGVGPGSKAERREGRRKRRAAGRAGGWLAGQRRSAVANVGYDWIRGVRADIFPVLTSVSRARRPSRS